MMSGSNHSPPADEFIFDPFGLHTNNNDDGSTGNGALKPPPQVTRLTRSDRATPDDNSETSRGSAALPPRLIVKFRAHEEVSAVAATGPENEGSSDVFVEGKLSAQITSSDAMKNLPFCLTAENEAGDTIEFQASSQFASVSSNPLPPNGVCLIHIPKTELAAVPIGTYSLSERVLHMPLLLERKVTIYANTVRVAVQVRSKLSNRGDLTDFTVSIAIPERVNGSTVEVLRGEGMYDDLKRTIKWTVDDLPKGESFMVSAQAQLWTNSTKEDQDHLKFPVLLRCSSELDQISTVEFRAVEAFGFPSSVTFRRSFSFRLLHRLP